MEEGTAVYLRDRDEGAISVPGCAQPGLGGAICKAEGRRQGERSGRNSRNRHRAHFPVSSVWRRRHHRPCRSREGGGWGAGGARGGRGGGGAAGHGERRGGGEGGRQRKGGGARGGGRGRVEGSICLLATIGLVVCLPSRCQARERHHPLLAFFDSCSSKTSSSSTSRRDSAAVLLAAARSHCSAFHASLG